MLKIDIATKALTGQAVPEPTDLMAVPRDYCAVKVPQFSKPLPLACQGSRVMSTTHGLEVGFFGYSTPATSPFSP